MKKPSTIFVNVTLLLVALIPLIGIGVHRPVLAWFFPAPKTIVSRPMSHTARQPSPSTSPLPLPTESSPPLSDSTPNRPTPPIEKNSEPSTERATTPSVAQPIPPAEVILEAEADLITRETSLQQEEPEAQSTVKPNMLSFHSPDRDPNPRPRPTTTEPALPRLAIVIDDCGQQPNQDFLDFPHPLTLAVIPRLPYSTQVAQQGFQHQKEIILHLPLQSKDGQAQHPETIRIGDSKQAITAKVEHYFELYPEISGVNNHQGSAATENLATMQPIVDACKRHHLYFLDSKTSSHSIAEKTALQAGVSSDHRDLFLDNIKEPDHIIQQLDQALSIAQEEGSAIVIGHCYPETHIALTRWIPDAKAHVQLVTLSEILNVP